jgi:ABC-type amino acid transport substrate-binding protein
VLDDVAKTIVVTRGSRSTTLRYDLTPFLGGGESIQFVADNAEELVALLDLELGDAEAFFSVASGGSIRFRRTVQQ